MSLRCYRSVDRGLQPARPTRLGWRMHLRHVCSFGPLGDTRPAYIYMHPLRARRSHSCTGHESFKCRQSLSSRLSHGHARAPECRCLRPSDHAAHIPPYTMRGYTRRCTSVCLRWPTEEPLSPCSIDSPSMPREMASCGTVVRYSVSHTQKPEHALCTCVVVGPVLSV